MIRCDRCGKSVKSATRIVAETRPKTYAPRWRDKKLLDRGGEGTEIAREEVACAPCLGQP